MNTGAEWAPRELRGPNTGLFRACCCQHHYHDHSMVAAMTGYNYNHHDNTHPATIVNRGPGKVRACAKVRERVGVRALASSSVTSSSRIPAIGAS
eukprot:15360356-Alexandrium_andersonii.AAC.1